MYTLLSRLDELEKTSYKGRECKTTGDIGEQIAWQNLFYKLQRIEYTGGYSQNCFSFFNFNNGTNRPECDARPTQSLEAFVSDKSAVNIIQLPLHEKSTGDDPKHYGQPQSWRDIKCRIIKLSKGLIIKTTCNLPTGGESEYKDPGKYKIFVCGFKNLYDYGRAISEGIVTWEQHMELFDVLLEMKQKCQANVNKDVVLINHNLDVDVLHFKFVCCTDEKCGFIRDTKKGKVDPS